MPFVKLDCGIVDSSLWLERDQRSIFITALLMAVPGELTEPTPQLKVRSLEPTGWTVPPGHYGFVEAAGTGIVRRDGMPDIEAGLTIIEQLGSPDPDSRSQDHEGRRLVRIDGGYIVLNYFTYREKDYTGAERQRRYRENRKRERTQAGSGDSNALRNGQVTGEQAKVQGEQGVTRYVTDADADADADVVVADGKPEPTSPQTPPAAENTDTLEIGPALRLTIALNKGLRDNPAIGEHYNPVIATSGASLQAAEELANAGIDISFAAAQVYALARAYVPKKRGDQINSITYLLLKIVDRWERERARIAAAAAPEPTGATNGAEPASTAGGNFGRRNGRRDLKGEGLIIYGRLRDSVREQTILNDPNDPGAGNYRVHLVDPAEIQNLDGPGATALAAIGGARRLANTREDESIAWKFAAAYAAACGAEP